MANRLQELDKSSASTLHLNNSSKEHFKIWSWLLHCPTTILYEMCIHTINQSLHPSLHTGLARRIGTSLGLLVMTSSKDEINTHAYDRSIYYLKSCIPNDTSGKKEIHNLYS